MQEKKKKLGGQQGELMRALEITMDDLIANDEGYITEEQQDAIFKRQSYQWQGFLGVAILISLFGALFVGLGAFNPNKLMPLLIMSLLFFGIGLTMGIGSLWYRQKVKNELARNEVATVQGIAVVNISLEESHLEINGMKLNASPDVLRRVQHLQPYIVHYLPESKVILSMEHISEDDNIREDVSRLQDEHEKEDSRSEFMDEDAQSSMRHCDGRFYCSTAANN